LTRAHRTYGYLQARAPHQYAVSFCILMLGVIQFVT
jgi:hypothetical protein